MTVRPAGKPTASSVTTRQVGVVGAGTMGMGIAATIVRAGHGVVVCDVDDERVARGLESVRRFLDGETTMLDGEAVYQRLRAKYAR